MIRGRALGRLFRRHVLGRRATDPRPRSDGVEADRRRRSEIAGRVGTWEWDLRNGTVNWSDGAGALLGLGSGQQGPAEGWIGMFHADDRSVVEQAVRRALGAGSAYEVEGRLAHSGRIIRVLGEIARDSDGRPLSVIGSMQDVTEWVEAERALRKSELRLLAAQQIAHVGSWDWDPGSDELDCSPEMCRIYGLESAGGRIGIDQLMGRLHPQDFPWAAKELTALRDGRITSSELEMRLVRGPDDTVWITAIANNTLDGEGRVVHLHGAVFDITERKRTERQMAIRESAISTSMAPMTISDSEARFVYVNKAFADLMRAPDAASLVGADAKAFVRDRVLAEQVRQELLHKGRWVGDLVDVDLEGGVHDIYVVANLIDGTEIDEPLVVATHLDVTEQNRTLRELRQRELQLRQAHQMARLGPLQFDRTTMCETMPAETRQLLGLTEDRDTFPVKEIYALIHPDDWPKLDEVVAAALASGAEQYTCSHRILSPTKGVMHVQIVSQIERDADGRILGTSGIIQDITPLREAEESLRATDALVRGMMEAASVGLLTADEGGRIALVNAEAARIFGRRESDMVGMSMGGLLAGVRPASHAETFQTALLDAAVSVDGAPPAEVDLTLPDGTVVPLEIAVRVMTSGPSGRAFVFAVQDISQRKRAEAQLHQVQKLETVGQLTGGVAHDFNNLLMAVQINLEMLKGRLNADPEAQEFAEAALAAVGRGADLTRRLLAFSRRQPLRPKAVDANALVADVGRILRRTLGEHIDICTALAEDLRPMDVDPSQLENVLLNLAVNARDAMPAGGRLTIETSNTSLAGDEPEAGGLAPGDYVMIAVTDTGTGMTAEVMERAFEPFFTTKEVGKGSGLGLSMAYGFARQSGGHISIDSEIGRGTAVAVYLPVSGHAAAAPEASLVQPSPRTGDEMILLVEDDPAVRQMVAIYLDSLGYTVVIAPDGPEAVRLVKAGLRPHLLLADLMLPKGMTGAQVAAAVQEQLPSCRTIFMSGYAEGSLGEHGRLDEGVTLLSKPFPRAVLADKIRELLDRMPA